jgi:hypothetical protein
MMLFFKEQLLNLFCRWCSERRTGSEARWFSLKKKQRSSWEMVRIGCIEFVQALSFFSKAGWNFCRRIEFPTS